MILAIDDSSHGYASKRTNYSRPESEKSDTAEHEVIRVRLTGEMSDDADSVAAAVKRLIIVCNNNKPVFRVKLDVLRQILSVCRLRSHCSQPIVGATLLILDLVILDVVAV